MECSFEGKHILHICKKIIFYNPICNPSVCINFLNKFLNRKQKYASVNTRKIKVKNVLCQDVFLSKLSKYTYQVL